MDIYLGSSQIIEINLFNRSNSLIETLDNYYEWKNYLMEEPKLSWSINYI